MTILIFLCFLIQQIFDFQLTIMIILIVSIIFLVILRLLNWKLLYYSNIFILLQNIIITIAYGYIIREYRESSHKSKLELYTFGQVKIYISFIFLFDSNFICSIIFVFISFFFFHSFIYFILHRWNIFGSNNHKAQKKVIYIYI